MVGRGRRAVAPSVSSTSNTPREALGQCGAIRRYRPPFLPQPRANRGFAIVASGFAATAGTATAPAPGKQATRVFLAFSLAVLHNIVYRQPTIPQNSKRFIHACRKDTVLTPHVDQRLSQVCLSLLLFCQLLLPFPITFSIFRHGWPPVSPCSCGFLAGTAKRSFSRCPGHAASPKRSTRLRHGRAVPRRS